MTDVAEEIAQVHREEWSRVVATLARRFGDLDIAEEMTAEAFATALERVEKGTEVIGHHDPNDCCLRHIGWGDRGLSGQSVALHESPKLGHCHGSQFLTTTM
jgi:hypothetical protein